MNNNTEKNKRTALVISRHWDNPTIIVTISDQRISLEMSIEDYLSAIASDIRHPGQIFTRAGLEEELIKANRLVLEKVKETSATVV